MSGPQHHYNCTLWPIAINSCTPLYYNLTKGGVDIFDQMCSYQSCSRMTKRWPLRFLWDFERSRGQLLYSVFSTQTPKQLETTVLSEETGN